MYINVFVRAYFLFAWAVIIMTLLLKPMPQGDGLESSTFTDKFVHALIFGVLSFLFYFLLSGLKEIEGLPLYKKNKRKANKICFVNKLRLLHPAGLFIWPVIFSLCYSLIFEFAQIWIPGRSSNGADFLASLVGIIFVMIFLYGDRYGK
jgi:hypothetical protein